MGFSCFSSFQIVTSGLPEVSPAKQVGKYVSPKDWNSLIQEDGTVCTGGYFLT